MQLGGDFGLPLTSNNKDKIAVSFIKHIEKNLTKTLISQSLTLNPSLKESFIPVISKYDFDIAYSILNTLNRFIKCSKDNLNLMSHHGVVYKISCHNCDVLYIGQIKRQLRTRIKQHNSDVRKKNLHL